MLNRGVTGSGYGQAKPIYNWATKLGLARPFRLASQAKPKPCRLCQVQALQF